MQSVISVIIFDAPYAVVVKKRAHNLALEGTF